MHEPFSEVRISARSTAWAGRIPSRASWLSSVRIYNTDTKKMIHVKVPVKKGKFTPDGDYAIVGCPGTGARIELSFKDPCGATTGRLLPPDMRWTK